MYIIIAVNSGKKDGMSVFTGAGVAIITPMKANGEVNYDKLGAVSYTHLTLPTNSRV